MKSLIDVLKKTEAWLRDRGIDTPRLDAELLMSHVLGMERLKLYMMFDRPMSEDELAALRVLMRRRGAREPLAYVLGSAGFHGIELIVRSGVLVPRPDTETLVDATLGFLDSAEGPVYVADVGCGSGAVGLAIASAHPSARIYATDVSPTALDVTRENVHALKLTDRVGVLRGSLLQPIPRDRPIDWVVSNPPYIPTRVVPTLQPEVAHHEPRLALDGGRDGLDIYHALIPAALERARQGLLVEVGHDQAAAVKGIFIDAGYQEVRTWKDLAGIERVVGGRVPARSNGVSLP